MKKRTAIIRISGEYTGCQLDFQGTFDGVKYFWLAAVDVVSRCVVTSVDLVDNGNHVFIVPMEGLRDVCPRFTRLWTGSPKGSIEYTSEKATESLSRKVRGDAVASTPITGKAESLLPKY